MSSLTNAQRLKMPPTSFGDPTRRLFPIMDQSDVDAASHLIGKAADPGAVKKRITAIARRKGFRLPMAWQDEVSAGAKATKLALDNAVDRATGHGG